MKRLSVIVVAGAAAALCFAGSATAQQKEIVIGAQCDRTGPTQIVGVVICPAQSDYFALVNAKGGLSGYMLRYSELDNEYKVPPAVEEYERQKREGAVSMMIYGTPQTQALNQRLEADHIPGTSPGFGISAAADGKRFQYLFP
ncbi:MAG TPA: ABC transporter substrate-binding protein, partial [Stellaceae bacterium]|nr:ABC transporter substrate-binding protein [Stellaceae bacterium]